MTVTLSDIHAAAHAITGHDVIRGEYRVEGRPYAA